MTSALVREEVVNFPNPTVFSYSIGILLSAISFGESPSKLVTKDLSTYIPASSIKSKMALLNYPSYPKGVLEKILQLKPPSNLSKQDGSISQDWALKAIGFFDVYNPLVQPINAQMIPCSDSVIVAVIDTGIDYTHTELQQNLWINRGETGTWKPSKANVSVCRDKSCNGLDDDGNGFIDDIIGWDFVHNIPMPYDTHGHGTHIAGIIGSEAANGFGIAGVCPRVSLMALKYYDNSGIGYNNLQNTVRAIQYAVKNGAHIINYSGGGSDPAPAEKLAIEEARAKGILFVAAAGNDSHNNDLIPYFPASYGLENIIAVASIDENKELLGSSNFGKTVHVAAPGLSVLSTLPKEKFGTMSGTSQATAFVTGAAALLISQIPSTKSYDYKRVKRWIQASGEPLSHKKDRIAGGILSLSKALKAQSQDSPSTPEIAIKHR